MNKLKKRAWVITLNTLVVLIFYFLFIKYFLRIKITDASGLITVGAIAYLIGVVYYIRKS